MGKRVKFSIRFKVLVILLLVVTAAVSTITFTMAKLFHTDKSIYVHDLTSEMAMHTATETRALLAGYQQNLQVFTRMLYDRELRPEHKRTLIRELFKDFDEFVAIILYDDGKELTSVYDTRILETAGIAKTGLSDYFKSHPIPFDQVLMGDVYIANATIKESLPAFVLAISHPAPDKTTDNSVIAAIIRLDGLQRLAGRSHAFTTFIADSQGNPLAHSNLQQVVKRGKIEWVAGFKGLKTIRMHGSTHNYVDHGREMVGGLAHIGVRDLLAGVEIPKAAAYLTARELLKNLVSVALILLLVAAVFSLFSSRLLTRPLERLLEATKIVAKGQFNVKVASRSRDEIGDLANSFNQMASELEQREKALQDTQVALVQSEKMAAFGQLGAGIAHEVKNPLAGILGLTQLCLLEAENETTQFKNLSLIEKETKRCKTIIDNLLKFSRQEKVAFDMIDVNRVALDTIAIISHQLGINQIKLLQELTPELPPVYGNANQIQQVLLNLMINAQQALAGMPGTIKLATSRLDMKTIKIQVTDDGPGIPEDVQSKIFEPFFTTKPVGQGTGLGLSVSYGIVKTHKGDIDIQSELGKGTVFTILLPAAEAGRQTSQAAGSDAPSPRPANG
jgi:two-component system NtrC family sensor kinase